MAFSRLSCNVSSTGNGVERLPGPNAVVLDLLSVPGPKQVRPYEQELITQDQLSTGAASAAKRGVGRGSATVPTWPHMLWLRLWQM